MPSATYNLIRQAILEKRNVIATYDNKRRQFSPHAIGHKNGHEHVLFYQFSGGSTSGLKQDGDPRNWRCCEVRKLSYAESVEGEWHTANNHSKKQTCIDNIDTRVNHIS